MTSERPAAVEEALRRLWNIVPVGYGVDLNTVHKYIEAIEDGR